MADCIIAGGAESMSYIPMGGYKPVPDYKLAKEGREDYYWNMGLTAEAVAKKYNVSREDQDEFAYTSQMRALKAQEEKRFQDQIVPIEVEHIFVNDSGKKVSETYTVTQDEGPRKGTNVEVLSKLRPVFAQGGSVTAGNSSQMSDGAAFVMVMSEKMVKELNLEPIARLVSFAAVGVEPKIMGIGPVKAVPKALQQAGLKLDDIELIELNEAFASQVIASVRELSMPMDRLNVNGGAIALGHPYGASGAILLTRLFYELQRRKGKYGLATLGVGGGLGIASVWERVVCY